MFVQNVDAINMKVISFRLQAAIMQKALMYRIKSLLPLAAEIVVILVNMYTKV